jgi:eukaryotic-like serine/threonine-protein kinase
VPRPAAAAAPTPTRVAGRAAERARAAQRAPSGWTAVGLAAAGAAVVLVGAVGGWTATRALGGQSAFTTVNVTTSGTATTNHRDAPLGFTLPVPADWAEYRLAPPGGEQSVSFLSPDGTEVLTVARAASIEAAQAVGDGATIRLLRPVTAVSGGPSGALQLAYRTETRTSWRRIVPAGGAVWTITLTVPTAGAGSLSEDLIDELTRGFTTVAT